MLFRSVISTVQNDLIGPLADVQGPRINVCSLKADIRDGAMVDEEMAYLSDIIDLFLSPPRLGRRGQFGSARSSCGSKPAANSLTANRQ